MENEAAIRLLRALIAVGLRQRESMANAAIRSVASQAGLDEFDAAHQYARQQGWLVESGKAFSIMLTPAGWRAARANRLARRPAVLTRAERVPHAPTLM